MLISTEAPVIVAFPLPQLGWGIIRSPLIGFANKQVD
jgi:hypothetical protein